MTREEYEALIAANKARKANKPEKKEATRNSPDTGEGFLSRLDGAISEGISDVRNVVNSATGTMSFGVTDLMDRHGSAIYRNIADQFQGNEKSYNDILAEVDAERQQHRDENKVSHTIGDIMGYMAGGAGMAQAGTQLAKNVGMPLAKQGWKAVAQRVLGAGAGGAAQDVAVQAGRGQSNIGRDAATGALGGAGGQVLGEAIAPVSRAVGLDRLIEKGMSKITGDDVMLGWGSRAKGKEDISRSIMDPTVGDAVADQNSIAGNLQVPEGFTPEKFRAASDAAGDTRLMGDVDPDINRLTSQTLLDPDIGASKTDIYRQAQKRIDTAEQEAENLVNQYFTPAQTKPQQLEMFEANRKNLGEQYDAMIAAPEFKDPSLLPVKRSNVAKQMQKLLPTTRNRSTETLMESLQKDVTEYLGANMGKRKYADDELISGEGLLALKKSIDDKLNAHWKGDQSSLDTEKIKYLGDVKGYINNLLNKKNRGYTNLSSRFAYEADLKDLAETAAAMVKGNKYDPEELGSYVASLDPRQKEVFVTAAINQWRNKARDQGKSTVKALMKGDNQERRRISALLPQGQLDEFLEKADTLMKDTENAERWLNDIHGTSRDGAIVYNPFQKGVYGAASAAAAASGQQAGALFSAARLLGGRQPSDIYGSASVLDLLSEANPATRNTMIDALSQARQGAPSSMAGAGIGVGLQDLMAPNQ